MDSRIKDYMQQNINKNDQVLKLAIMTGMLMSM